MATNQVTSIGNNRYINNTPALLRGAVDHYNKIESSVKNMARTSMDYLKEGQFVGTVTALAGIAIVGATSYFMQLDQTTATYADNGALALGLGLTFGGTLMAATAFVADYGQHILRPFKAINAKFRDINTRREEAKQLKERIHTRLMALDYLAGKPIIIEKTDFIDSKPIIFRTKIIRYEYVPTTFEKIKMNVKSLIAEGKTFLRDGTPLQKAGAAAVGIGTAVLVGIGAYSYVATPDPIVIDTTLKGLSFGAVSWFSAGILFTIDYINRIKAMRDYVTNL